MHINIPEAHANKALIKRNNRNGVLKEIADGSGT